MENIVIWRLLLDTNMMLKVQCMQAGKHPIDAPSCKAPGKLVQTMCGCMHLSVRMVEMLLSSPSNRSDLSSMAQTAMLASLLLSLACARCIEHTDLQQWAFSMARFSGQARCTHCTCMDCHCWDRQLSSLHIWTSACKSNAKENAVL